MPGELRAYPIQRVDRSLTLIQLLTLTYTRSGDIYIGVYIKMRGRGHKPASEEYSYFAGKGPFQKGGLLNNLAPVREWPLVCQPVLKVLTLSVPTTDL